MKRLVLTCLVGLLLQACGPMQIKNAETGTWVPVQAGTLEVHRDIQIPAGRGRAFFQAGELVGRINEFKPFCQLGLTTVRETPQTVHPDSFAVTPAGSRFEQIVDAAPIQVASVAMLVGMSSTDSGTSRVTHMLYFNLQSQSQANVYRLACGGAFDYPANATAPTLQEIAAALGGYATLSAR